MKRPPRLVLLLVLALLLSLVGAVDRVEAQTVIDAGPTTTVVITPGADAAKITYYEIGLFAVGATDPIQFATVQKTAMGASGADLTTLLPRLLFGGPFEVRARGCAPQHPSGVACPVWKAAAEQVRVAPFPVLATRVVQ